MFLIFNFKFSIYNMNRDVFLFALCIKNRATYFWTNINFLDIFANSKTYFGKALFSNADSDVLGSTNVIRYIEASALWTR